MILSDENTNKNKLDIKTAESARNPAFELLRIVAIIMIVGLHLLGHGGILEYAGNVNFSIWSIEAFISVAVNCYILISGYFLITSNFKLRKLFWLYFQVMTYSLIIYVIFVLAGKADFSFVRFAQMLMPISTKRYWFILSYAGLYLISPFLNKLILNLNKRQMQILVLLLFLFFCRINVLFPMFSTLNKDSGYGLVWFVCVYCFAAYIRLYYDRKINKYIYLLLYIAISFASAALKVYGSYADLFDYSSVTICLSSICLFLFFRELSIKSSAAKKMIYTLAPLSLGIYLISDNRYIRSVLYTDIFDMGKYISLYNIYSVIFAFILAVFVICALIEYIRKNIIFKSFEENKKVNSFFDNLQSKILSTPSNKNL